MQIVKDASPGSAVVEVRDLTKNYSGRNGVAALRGVSARFTAGSFSAVMGPSGSGKSTLLNCAAGLERPTSGQVLLGGRDITSLREPALTRARRKQTGFVFQSFHLVPALSVWQNVLLPQRLAGGRIDRRWAGEVLDRVGLADRRRARPDQLSGGQQQRVAIARALAGRPEVVFADEPTGALDLAAGREVLALLRQAVDTLGQTVIMVTHDPAAAAWADRVLFLADGRTRYEIEGATAVQIAETMTELSAA